MKKNRSKLKSIVAVFLAFIVALMVGYLALRNPVRVDVSDSKYYQLSEKTIQLLDGLDHDVQVTVFFQEEDKLYDDIENLIEEYQYHCPGIDVEWVDPLRDPSRAKRLGNTYGITPSQVIVFDINGRTKKLYLSDLVDLRMEQGRKEPVMTAFKGEQAISSAIQALVEGETPVVYFLVGHGEHRVTDFDQMVGYSDVGTIIFRDNIDIKELVLTGKQKIPENAAALIVAGPNQKMSTVEADMIEGYLSRGGRLLVLLDALKETGLEDMLRRWGVALRTDIVVDPENTLQGSDVHIRRYNPHPITMKMNAIVRLILPRSVEPLIEKNDAGKSASLQTVVPLLYTSEQGWSETQVNETTAKFDENTGDRRGTASSGISLGVAVERGSSKDELDVQIEPSKMVIIGDSDFVSNGAMVGGNADLFMSALNWLLDRDETMAIAPKPIEEVKLGLSRQLFRMLFWINIAGIPGLAVVMGMVIWSHRRK